MSNSSNLPSYHSNSRKGNTPRLLPIYPRGEQITYLGDVRNVFPGGLVVGETIQIN